MKKYSKRRSKKRFKDAPPQNIAPIDNELIEKKQKYLHLFIIMALFAFGLYLSILYFGHQQVPNPDFSAFFRTGKQVLNLQKPTSFKRGPVVGMLQYSISLFLHGIHPELTAGWLLNAILYPLTTVLFYLLAKELFGTAAVWFAILATINPWHLYIMREPIAETTLIFFTVLTTYLIIKHSRWRYPLAAITTLVRYDGLVLIAAAFLLDIIESKNWKQRIKAFLTSVIAATPVFLWVVAMRLTQKGPGGVSSMHYVRNYIGEKRAFRDFSQRLWDVSVTNLCRTTTQSSFEILMNVSKVLLFVSLVLALIYMLYRKHYKALVLLTIFSLTFLGQALRTHTRPRYAIPIAWMTLMLCFYGLIGLWRLVTASKFQDNLKIPFSNTGPRLPKQIVIALQIFAIIAAVVWFCSLVALMPKLIPFSTKSTSVPYVAMGLVAAVVIARIFVYKTRFLPANLAVAALMCLMIVSSQFSLAQRVGNGNNKAEFKQLAQWYLQNAEPGEKLVTTLPNIVSLFAQEHKQNFISLSADTPEKFVKKCYKADVDYVTWDSRIGFSTNDKYYRQWGIASIAMLSKPRSIGPFEFLHQIKQDDRQFINIFRLRELTPQQKEQLFQGKKTSPD